MKHGWVQEFAEKDTAPRRFRTPEGKKQVPTMHLIAELGYAMTEDWQVVSLSAHGGVNAVILLPYGDLARFEPTLTPNSVVDLLAAPTPRQVDLRLPTFTVSEPVPLHVTEGGINSAPTVNEPSQAEETAGITWMCGITENPVLVKVDRPFLFAVLHEETLYCVVRVTDPVT